ncbi:MAG: hypothetical protein LBO69_06000 [Ignavibacteria bacterium]|jgi:hypothetical protein|nr:hypothetical protein [Ignavibacteria bacterium]
MYSEKLEKLIEMALSDGKYSEKELLVIFKQASEEGIDTDEFEMYLNSKLKEKNVDIKSNVFSKIKGLAAIALKVSAPAISGKNEILGNMTDRAVDILDSPTETSLNISAVAEELVPIEEDIDKLLTIENALQYVRNDFMNSSVSSERALANAIEAQLAVLKFVKHPDLFESSFDLMIEHLDKSVKAADNAKLREDLRTKASIMTNSMVFFMQSMIIFEKDENRKKAEELAAQACDMVADATTEIIMVAIPGGAAKKGTSIAVKRALSISGNDLFDSAFKGENSFFQNAIRFFSKKKAIKEAEYNFYSFLSNTIAKLNRHKSIFGKSKLLSELIYRYMKDLAEFDNRTHIFEPLSINPPHYMVRFFPFLGTLVVCGLIAMINNDTILIVSVISGVVLAFCVGMVLVAKSKYQKIIDAFNKKKEIYEAKIEESRQYYLEIAQIFG